MTDEESIEGGLGDDDKPHSQIASPDTDEFEQYNWRRSLISGFESTFCSVRKYMRSTRRCIFGDRNGFILFCAAIAFYALSWRIGFLINDTYTVANGFVAVSEGQLRVDRAVYGPGLGTPGMYEVDGVTHARNYGQIILALPFLWVIQGVDAVADLRVALAAGWAILLLFLSLQIGNLSDRNIFGQNSRILAAYSGSLVALGAFTLIVRWATIVDPFWHHLLALQTQTMVAAGLTGVIIYRLLNRIHGRLIGLAAGAAVVFVSPIAFWATFPKRHVLVALGVVVSAYCLFRSREAIFDESTGHNRQLAFADRTFIISKMTKWRALAYVPVGIIAWVNALEGLILLGALLAIDIPTGGNRILSLAFAWITCFFSLIPMFVTNFLIAGNPLEPPMAHGRYGSGGLAKQSGGGSGGGGGTGGAPPSGTDGDTLIDSFLGAMTVAGNSVYDGITVVTSEFDSILYVFIRSGYVGGTVDDAWRLSFLEVMPITAALVVIPIGLWRMDFQQRIHSIIEARQLSPAATIDAFAIAYSLVVTLVFLPRLPMVAELTVRYLLVLFPLAIYGVARVSSIQRIINEHYRLCIGIYLTALLVGGQIFFLYLYMTNAVIGESFQVHAFVGLGLATIVAVWALLDSTAYQDDRIGAIAVGLAAASGTIFVLLAQWWYFADIGSLALPLI